jgi:hypothetical protein
MGEAVFGGGDGGLDVDDADEGIEMLPEPGVFSPIVAHCLGSHLQLMEIKQGQLSQGLCAVGEWC